MSEIIFVGANFEAPISSIRMYSDSTTMVKTDAFAEICEKADTMILRPSNLSGFVAGLSIIDSIIAVNGENTIKKLVLPYIPGARQDRVNPTGDVGFMLSTVGRIINSYEFESVVAVDPHSEASNAHISNLDVYPYEALYSHLWTGYSGVIAPDKGRGRSVSLRPDWDFGARVWAMQTVLKDKFSDPELRQKLLETGNLFLVEENEWHDQFWGNCTCDQHATTPGTNMLGELLMALRFDLQG